LKSFTSEGGVDKAYRRGLISKDEAMLAEESLEKWPCPDCVDRRCVIV
jgi:hypothetical protein